MPGPSIPELQRAIQISEQIQKLEAELASILNWRSSETLAIRSPKRRGRPRKVSTDPEVGAIETGNSLVADGRKKKRKMSAEARERIAAAQRTRWAKQKGVAEPATGVAMEKPKKKKRRLSPEARAKIVAAVKARWERQKKAEK